ncbi:MAG TPA: CHASE sensor domain-containing protein, partial [Candidatus Synoicihabitans sp.]|nr:CHASE sensor domain-containing protein [Candidatus Synoicihabitans sp.]
MISRWLQNVPIKRKLIAITLGTSMVALPVALGVFLVAQLKLTRDSATQDLSALAEILAANLAGPLAFEDAEAATLVLRTLRARPEVREVRVTTAAGREFSRVTFGSVSAPLPDGPPGGSRVIVAGARIQISVPVKHGEETLGRLDLAADVRSQLWRFALLSGFALLLVLVAALALSYGLAVRLQGMISGPLISLAGTARAIALRKDYSLRAERQSNDEIGHLT